MAEPDGHNMRTPLKVGSSCCTGTEVKNWHFNIHLRMPSTAASWAEPCHPLLQGQRYLARHRCALLPIPMPLQVQTNTRCYTCERKRSLASMCTYRANLTCILWLQVEEPGKGEPLHLSWG